MAIHPVSQEPILGPALKLWDKINLKECVKMKYQTPCFHVLDSTNNLMNGSIGIFVDIIGLLAFFPE